MELEPLMARAAPPPPRLQLLPSPSRAGSASDTSGSDVGLDRRRGDRRRGRLNAELLAAVLQGDRDLVDRRLVEGASVDATCRRTRTTVLQLAVACGHEAVVRLLLSRNAAVCRRDRVGRQAVHLAAAAGKVELLRLLLDCTDVDPNSIVMPTNDEQEDKDCLDSWSHDHYSLDDVIPDITSGATPLHVATQRLHLDCVEELLSRGARVDIVDARGLTALDVAGETPTASATGLLDDLADALPTPDETQARIKNMKQKISGKPAMRFFRGQIQGGEQISKKEQPDFFPSHLDQPTDYTNTPTEQKSALYPSNPALIITPSSPVRPTPSLAQKVVYELIKKGAKMTKSRIVVKQDGVHNQMAVATTCLHTSIEHQDLPLIEYLLDHDSCQLTWNSEGLTPLHLAVSRKLLEPLRILLEKNKTSRVVDARDSQGRTPLLLAVAESWEPGVGLLLEAGADVKLTSNTNQTVLHIAASSQHTQLLEELLNIPESVKILDSHNSQHETPLFCAVSAGQLDCLRLLISHGADVTSSLPGDITLLHLVAERGDKTVLQALLADSRIAALKNVRCKENKGGTTALHLAALGGFLDCVELLISAGSDLFTVTSDRPHYGSTALHLAAAKGHCKIVECIVKHNKDTMCVKNVDGWYPLHVAARFAKEECTRCLLLNGANLAATVLDSGHYKRTAFDIIVYSIVHPALFLQRIFDASIHVNEYPLNNPKCIVKVSYDLLQPLGPHRKQLKVLESMLNCGKNVVQEKLLLHPLVETFLYLKWMKLRVFFFLMMALYIIFTVSLTTMAMFFYVLKIESTAVDTCVNTCRVTLCTSLTLITLQELLQAMRMKRYYLRDLESWVKWASFLLSSVVVLTRPSRPWLVHVAAVAVLLSWLELLFLLSRWPAALGFYILMFFTVAKNVLRVLATFTFVILGFTFAFMIQFEAQDPFDSWWDALVKVMVMTLEFDYGDLFTNVKGVTAPSVVGRSIFLMFMVLVAIVLMNLLVGLAVSDIAALEKQGRAQRLAKQIDFLSLLELFVYNRHLFGCCPNKFSEACIKKCRATEPCLIIEPGKPLRKTQHSLPHQLIHSVINNIVNREKTLDETYSDDISISDNMSLVESHSLPSSSGLVKSSDIKPVIGCDTQIKNTLETILNELAIIKEDLQKIKRHNTHIPTTCSPSNEDQS